MNELSSEVKSVFLTGKPTRKKTELLLHTQNEYCRVINYYIQNLIHMSSVYLDIFNNNPTSSLLRTYEKETRHIHKLGSAYGQNMLDHAVKELHNHFTRIRNKLYGYVQEQYKEMLPYASFISLLNCAVANTDELEVIQTLIDYENQKKKIDSEKIKAYTNLLQWLESLSAESRTEYKEQISILFYERLHTWKAPQVRHAPLQLDSRLSTIEKSHRTREDFVVHVKLLGSKD